MMGGKDEEKMVSTSDHRHPRPPTTPTGVAIAAALATASVDAAAVAARAVPTRECPSDAASVTAFVRDHVGPRAPALLTGVASHWPTPPPWSVDNFVAAAGGETVVTVAATPDGRADAVTKGGLFVQPLDVPMRLATLVARLRAGSAAPHPRPCPVLYAQRQCSSLTEFPRLSALIPSTLGAWADAAFGPSPPDAVNVWVGGPHSSTSWHRDAYENVAITLAGVKTFHLLPPGDGWRLALAQRAAAHWTRPGAVDDAAPGDRSSFVAIPDDPPTSVRWAGAPPPPPHAVRGVDADPAAFPLLYDGGAHGLPRPLSVNVPAGLALYLPPLWWHCTTQTGDDDAVCVSVNYWCDMAHDGRWAAARLADEVLTDQIE